MANAKNSAKREWFAQYLVALGTAGIAIAFFYVYAVVRYGEIGWSSLNKSLAVSSLFLLGYTLLLGPFSRMYNALDGLFKYRKEVGIMALYVSAAHVFLSMFVLARRGPWGLYLSQPYSAYPGIIALGIMVFLLVISGGGAMKLLGTRQWWKLQYQGARLAFVLIAVHLIVLKYNGMVAWLRDRGAGSTEGMASLPPLALLSTVIVVYVVAVKLSELAGRKASGIITMCLSLATAAFTVWLFL